MVENHGRLVSGGDEATFSLRTYEACSDISTVDISVLASSVRKAWPASKEKETPSALTWQAGST